MIRGCERLVGVTHRVTALFKRTRRTRKTPVSRTFDDKGLLRRLEAGWPVWKLAEFYGTSTTEIRLAIGAAVTNGDQQDPLMFGGDPGAAR